MSRSEARKIGMTCLYQLEIRKENHIPYDVAEILDENMDIQNEFVKEIVYGVVEHDEILSSLANQYLKNWDIKRLDKTGACILKMAFYELKYMDTPPVVVINEAVELAKTYTEEDLAKMINAALDNYVKESL